MPLQATSGAASYDAFGGGVPVIPNYIEEVFSTYLYTGNGSAQTITNGIDLATKGGMVWTKSRSASGEHNIVCNDVGLGKWLVTNTTQATQSFAPNGYAVPVFNTTGVTLSDSADQATSSVRYTSWTFRKQPKFFDVVTYTGNGTGSRAIAHNLGSVPGCVIIKKTSGTSSWAVWHRGNGVSAVTYFDLNTTAAGFTDASYTAFTSSTTFTVDGIGGATGSCNDNGATYVAYLFAHDAGGFGLTGTDNVISCGSFTPGAGGTATVTLGYEPQWILVKATGTTGNWTLIDTMRNYSLGGNPSGTNQYLRANTSGAELEAGTGNPTATGFFIDGVVAGSQPHIYIAIRRGPMKVPTVGTSVFSPDLYTGNGTTQSITSGSPPLDLVWIKGRTGSENPRVYDRLRGATISLAPDTTAAETTRANGLTAFTQTGFTVGSFGNENSSGTSIIAWDFKRAPSFFDVVCYSPPSSSVNTYSHNLGVIPELMIIKTRDSARRWVVYTQTTGNTQALHLNTNDAVNSTGNNYFNSTSPTASVFTLNNNFGDVCNGGGFGVAYLFATLAGVSKVGSYTGTATTLQVDCGFTGGARFVLIKKTSGTGSWYVWDSSRGIVSGNDPYLLLNSTAAEVTNTDYIDTYSAGFEISSTAPSEINENGGSFIFLAIS